MPVILLKLLSVLMEEVEDEESDPIHHFSFLVDFSLLVLPLMTIFTRSAGSFVIAACTLNSLV
jgi:hypothetical protein